MDHAARVRVFETVGDGCERAGDEREGGESSRGERSLRLGVDSSGSPSDAIEPLRERLAIDLLHRVVRRVFGNSDAVDRHEARMREPPRRTRLPEKPLEDPLVERRTRREHLEGDRTVHRPLPRFVHDAHSAAAEFRSDRVITELADRPDRVFPLGISADELEGLELREQPVGEVGVALSNLGLVDASPLAQTIDV